MRIILRKRFSLTHRIRSFTIDALLLVRNASCPIFCTYAGKNTGNQWSIKPSSASSMNVWHYRTICIRRVGKAFAFYPSMAVEWGAKWVETSDLLLWMWFAVLEDWSPLMLCVGSKISSVNLSIRCSITCVEFQRVPWSPPCSVSNLSNRSVLLLRDDRLCFSLGAFKVDLNQCEEIYRHFSSTVFHRNKALGIGSLITSQSYYDTKSFENYLRLRMGERLMLKSSIDADSPKVNASCHDRAPGLIICTFLHFSSASLERWHYRTVTNCIYSVIIRSWCLLMRITMERVNIKYGKQCVPRRVLPAISKSIFSMATSSKWASVECGTCRHVWRMPFFYKDGGLIANNPTSIALHECKLLWPGEDIQCVVSLGNGRPPPDVALQSKSMSCT